MVGLLGDLDSFGSECDPLRKPANLRHGLAEPPAILYGEEASSEPVPAPGFVLRLHLDVALKVGARPLVVAERPEKLTHGVTGPPHGQEIARAGCELEGPLRRPKPGFVLIREQEGAGQQTGDESLPGPVAEGLCK